MDQELSSHCHFRSERGGVVTGNIAYDFRAAICEPAIIKGKIEEASVCWQINQRDDAERQLRVAADDCRRLAKELDTLALMVYSSGRL